MARGDKQGTSVAPRRKSKLKPSTRRLIAIVTIAYLPVPLAVLALLSKLFWINPNPGGYRGRIEWLFIWAGLSAILVTSAIILLLKCITRIARNRIPDPLGLRMLCSGSPQCRLSKLEKLVGLGPEVVPELIAHYEGNRRYREALLEILDRTWPGGSGAALMHHLTGSTPRIHSRVCMILRDLRPPRPEFIPLLMAEFRRKPGAERSYDLEWALRPYGERVLEPLLAVVTDRSVPVEGRIEAALDLKHFYGRISPGGRALLLAVLRTALAAEPQTDSIALRDLMTEIAQHFETDPPLSIRLKLTRDRLQLFFRRACGFEGH